ncbi:hypothetical protein [Acinetobacter sp. YH16051]|uniref:hypothetical protein n=1 Tax=Acinetobacter sp. YH16051 TaxID=2601190 RepID=UPI0015D30214|nr:hypothetical protein [Acinetobacter sp. YH16051]
MKFYERVIRDFGGYEKCKDILSQPNIGFIMNAHALRDHMLEYRRQHNIFEVGDKVVLAQSYPLDTVNEIKRIENLTPHIKGSETKYFLENSLGCWSFQIKHATDEEIKAGKRLEVNQ